MKSIRSELDIDGEPSEAERGYLAALSVCDHWKQQWTSEARRAENRAASQAFEAMAAAAGVLAGLIEDDMRLKEARWGREH